MGDAEAEHAQALAAVEQGAKAGDFSCEGQTLEHREHAVRRQRDGDDMLVWGGDAERTQTGATIEQCAKVEDVAREGKPLKRGELVIGGQRWHDTDTSETIDAQLDGGGAVKTGQLDVGRLSHVH